MSTYTTKRGVIVHPPVFQPAGSGAPKRIDVLTDVVRYILDADRERRDAEKAAALEAAEKELGSAEVQDLG